MFSLFQFEMKEDGLPRTNITLGVCVMEKKVKWGFEFLSPFLKNLCFSVPCIFSWNCVVSNDVFDSFSCSLLFDISQANLGPMLQILERLQAFGEFEVVNL